MMNKNGFTLIELIVVLTIIFILVALAGISGKTWLNKYQVESQMKVMSADLMNARVSAMQRNRTYFVVFSPTPTATQYTVYEDTNPTPDGNGTFEPADTKILQKSFSSNFALTIPGAAFNSINFYPKGLVSMSPGPMGTEQTVRVAALFGVEYDCLTISETKIRMGAWNGANCVVK